MKTSDVKKSRLIAAVIITALIITFFYYIRVVLTPFILGFMLAYILEPPVSFLEKQKIPRSAAIIVIYVILAALFVFLVLYALPVLLKDLYQIIEMIPSYAAEVQKGIHDIEDGYKSIMIPDGIRQVIDDTIIRAEVMVVSIFQGLITALIRLFSQAFNLVLAPILGFYFLMEYNSLGRYFMELVPVRYRQELNMVGEEINHVVKGFIRGNLIVSLLVSVMAALGMMFIGMDFPVLIGIIVGVTNLIPYFGAVIATIPAFFLALLKSKWLALYVLGIMLLIQQVEGNIITPKVLGNCLGLHPLTIIFALLVGGELWGLTGLLLAAPAAGIMKVLLKHLYLRLI